MGLSKDPESVKRSFGCVWPQYSVRQSRLSPRYMAIFGQAASLAFLLR
jgi:hypothetical protein